MAQSIIRTRLTAEGSYTTIYIRAKNVSEIYNSTKMEELAPFRETTIMRSFLIT